MKALFSLVCVICSCSAQFLDGGISDADIHGTDIQGYAKDFLARYTGANGERFDAVTVLKARQQVVNGMNYWLTLRISNAHSAQMCDVRMYVQSWTNTEQVESQKCHPITTRAGEYKDHAIDDTIRKMAGFAVSMMDFESGTSNALVRVSHAMTQTVAGTNYKLTLDLGNSRMCTVVVFDQPWTHSRQLTSNSCASPRRQLNPTGYPFPVDSNDTHVQEVLFMAANQANAHSNDEYSLTLKNIQEVTEQVVAGYKYEFDMYMGESNCKNDGRAHPAAQCPVKRGGLSQKFHVAGIWQSWVDPQYTVTVTLVRP